MNNELEVNSPQDLKELALKELLGGLADLGFGSNICIEGAEAVDQISNLYARAVDRLKDTNLRPWVIHSDSTNSFWCEAHAYWTEELCDATHYFETALPSDFDANDCRLISLDQAALEHSHTTSERVTST